ncbi:hypothetical protein D3C76_651600 [compost metagenome]
MKFIEDQQPHALQPWVGLQPAGEDTLGDHFDTGLGPDLAVQADAVADGFPDLFPQLAGQPFGGRAGRQAARFEHHDGLPGQPWRVQQRQRHAGGLAGAGRRFEHGFVAVFQCLAQGGQHGIDR